MSAADITSDGRLWVPRIPSGLEQQSCSVSRLAVMISDHVPAFEILLMGLVEPQPGCTHPVSDGFAVSVIAPVIPAAVIGLQHAVVCDAR